jgi:hypothetical protein
MNATHASMPTALRRLLYSRGPIFHPNEKGKKGGKGLIATFSKAAALRQSGDPGPRSCSCSSMLCLHSVAQQRTWHQGQMSNAESPKTPASINPATAGPFLNPLLLAKKAKPSDEEESRGTPPPGIAGTYIAQAVLQGTSIRADGRMAIVRGADTRAYFVKEGDRLFDGYLKTIASDSITLIRETKMRSGKILTQDVTKRLRTP